MLLPKTESEIATMIENGRRIAQNMSWDVVVSDHLLPTLEKILLRRHAMSKITVNSRN